MSQSPTDPTQSLTRYRQGWKALNRLLHEDRSFSGNEKNCAFLNMRDGRFASVSSVSGLDFDDDSRALALCDWDFDGKLDLWMSARTAPRIRFMHNQTTKSGHFVAVQLQGNGTTTNRDAIGARVEVITSSPKKSVLTLHAGEGFLTQSSRWLHFGLGDETTVQAVTVQWPGGSLETYRNMEVDQFYVINQELAQATKWKPTGTRNPIIIQKQPAPTSSQVARIIPPYHLPLPNIDYVDPKSGPQRLSIESPTLVTVWSSSCANCLRELSVWSQAADDFRDHGLDVVAINADLDATSVEIAQREEMLQKMGFGFTSLTPTPETVRCVDYFQRALMDLWKPMPVPCSFLVDRFGRVVSIYKGPVELEQIWSDMQLFSASPEQLHQAGLPFAGRWGTGFPDANPQRIATQMIEHSLLAQAIDYLQHFLTTSEKAGAKISKVKQTDILFTRSVLLASTGRDEEAIIALEACRALNPTDYRVRTALANHYIKQKNFPAAELELVGALKINPNDISLRRSLSTVLLQQRKYSSAIPQLKLLLQRTPKDFTTHFNLGTALEKSGQGELALKSYRAALAIRSTFLPAANGIAWIMSTHPDAKLRNGKMALRVAKQMCQQTEFKQPSLLDTLAAAYAENGDFKRAAEIADRAIALLSSTPNSQDLPAIKRRRDLYAQQRRFRDQASAN